MRERVKFCVLLALAMAGSVLGWLGSSEIPSTRPLLVMGGFFLGIFVYVALEFIGGLFMEAKNMFLDPLRFARKGNRKGDI